MHFYFLRKILNSEKYGLKILLFQFQYYVMLPIAGQTAGPNELKFFGDTYGWPKDV